MTNFLRYAIRETCANLWRNRLMTMAAVLTVTVSLGLVGSALYLKQGAAQASATWEREAQVQVYMKPSATAPELAYVKSRLYTSPYVTGWSRPSTRSLACTKPSPPSRRSTRSRRR